MSAQNDAAVAFTRLQTPGHPLVLINVWDAVSARAVARLPDCKALASPSAGIANAIGLEDDDLTLEANLGALKGIVQVAKEYNKPLTADMQDGYGSRLEECVTSVVDLGIVGINLEDCNKENGQMYSNQEAARRIETVRKVAAAAGVPDLHINARCDTLLHGGTVQDAIERGNAYLAAGATTIFVWGGPNRGTTREEVVELCRAFRGKLNVSMRIYPGNLTVQDLAGIGVARISIGPWMQRKAMQFVTDEADKILKSA